jgi:FkbM family methyltransferase
MRTDIFSLDRFLTQNGTHVEADGPPLRAVGPEGQWSYAVVFAKQPSGAPAGPAEVVVRATAAEGRIGIGLVDDDFSTYFCETELPTDLGETDVVLSVERLEEVAAIIVRNAGRHGRPRFAVSSIGVRELPAKRFPAPDPRLRGFQRKSSLDDQRRLLLGEAATIFDVGANAGDTVAAYLAAFPDTRVHAFEAHPRVAGALADRFSGEPRVTVHAVAVGAPGTMRALHTFTNTAINSLLPMTSAGVGFADGSVESLGDIAVTTVALDAFCCEHRIEAIDILKIDTQGAELDVLAGAHDLLQAGRIRLLLCEVVFVPVYDGQATYFDVARLLASYAYDVYDFYDFQYHADGRVKWGDALFMRRGTV